MKKTNKDTFEKLNTYTNYKPKDENLRSGFNARIKKIKQKQDRIEFYCGGQVCFETIDNFIQQYVVK